ncbi:MAG: glycoside hydrolase family 3 N-terminal domain-containing protein [Acidobacteriota bacterium]
MTAPAAGLFGVGISGPALTEEERRVLERDPPGAIVLFRRNVESIEGVQALTRELRDLPGRPFVCVDMEGGPVDRFREILGASAAFRDAARSGLSREAGEIAGEACRLLGVQVDLAPVVDRMLPGASERVLAGRCAAGDPEGIIAAASAFLDGLHASGTGGCVKHFPGLGRADLDTHQALPFLPDDPDEESRDLAPFAATMDLARAVMISHAAGPDGLPSTLSPARATALLRGSLGFRGAAFSDDLEMGALSAFGEVPDRAAEALRAGCDLLLVCSRIEDYPASVRQVEETVSEERRREAADRVADYAARLPQESTRPSRTAAALRDAIRDLRDRTAESTEA